MFFEKPVTRRTPYADRRFIVFQTQDDFVGAGDFRMRDTTLAGARTLLRYFDKTNWFLNTERGIGSGAVFLRRRPLAKYTRPE